MKSTFLTALPYAGHSATQIFRALSENRPGYIWEYSKKHGTPVIEIGILPRLTVEVNDGWVRLIEQGRIEQRALDYYRFDPLEPIATMADKYPGVGFLGYDAARYYENIKGLVTEQDTPDAYYISPQIKLVLNPCEQQIQVFAQGSNSAGEEFVAKLKKYLEETNVERPELTPNAQTDIPSIDGAAFISQVERAKEYIYAGDVFQVVLGQELRLPKQPDPFDAYERLRALNPSPYHFLVRFKDSYLIGASPELYLESSDTLPTVIRMRPVAGTYGKKSASCSAQQLSSALVQDEKELAEHIMLVDHARNDIGRVAQIGSVVVRDLCSVETYRDVHHIVSEVRGTLQGGETIFSAFRSCFPIATLTGTPKIRAMEIIAELEKQPRGLFGGSVFSVSGDAIESTVIIRSLVVTPNASKVWAGAGIVADSDPKREHQECLLKANAVLHAAAGSQ